MHARKLIIIKLLLVTKLQYHKPYLPPGRSCLNRLEQVASRAWLGSITGFSSTDRWRHRCQENR